MAIYEIYKKTAEGKRGTIIEAYTKFTATLRYNEVGKWQLSGVSDDYSPLNEGDGIIIYRDGIPFISGYVKEITEDVDESYSNGRVVSWTADGNDDNGLLTHRVIIPDPVNLDLSTEAYQTIRDYGGNAILEYIDTQAGQAAKTGREIPNLTVDVDKNLGWIQTYKARLENLWDFVVKISSSQALGIRVVWDGDTGQYKATVYTPTDKSNLIIFSREFGNIKKWTRKRSAPAANAVWVAGQGQATDRMFSYREDPESISRWGRIEAVKDRRDISNEPDEQDPRTPQEILDDTAEELIQANKAAEGYELELAPIDRIAYRDDWDLGDIVMIRVGTDEFKAIIEEVKIDYASGVETIVPSVGTINRGQIAKTYSTIQTISDRVAVLEKDEGGSNSAIGLIETHTHDGVDTQKISAKNILDLYPVGSIYMSMNSTNPSTYFGGTWIAQAQGRVLVGIDPSDTSFDTVRETGGEKAHTLTVDEMPRHRHWVSSASRDDGNGTGCGQNNQDYGLWADAGSYSANDPNKTYGRNTAYTGGNGSHNNLQPYLVCYIWERTA